MIWQTRRTIREIIQLLRMKSNESYLSYSPYTTKIASLLRFKIKMIKHWPARCWSITK